MKPVSWRVGCIRSVTTFVACQLHSTTLLPRCPRVRSELRHHYCRPIFRDKPHDVPLYGTLTACPPLRHFISLCTAQRTAVRPLRSHALAVRPLVAVCVTALAAYSPIVWQHCRQIMRFHCLAWLSRDLFFGMRTARPPSWHDDCGPTPCAMSSMLCMLCSMP